MQLDPICFKIDRPNAKAMLHGFRRDGRLVRQSIWLAVRDRAFPALLTLQRAPSRFKLSRIGEAMEPENFSMPLKYVAGLDSEYFIKNESALWEAVCSNGLFDVWSSGAAFLRFAEARSDPAEFRIQLLRIYEIGREFSAGEIRSVTARIDRLISSTREVEIKGPVIADDQFGALKDLLERSVAPYLTRPPRRVEEYREGRELLRLHRRRERSPKAVRRKKETVLAASGKLLCEVCDFDFAVAYGDLGVGFAECHHRVPLAQLKVERRIRLSELAIVCANCHRMLHRRPMCSVEELRKIVLSCRGLG